MAKKKIAIACQGGGTHAAFTWGVLTQILETKKKWDAESGGREGFDICAISGTSAGALCALATWYGLVPNAGDPACGSIDKAVERLNFLWRTFAANTPTETSHNMFLGTALELKEKGFPFPGLQPSSVMSKMALSTLALFGARQQYLSFPALLDTVCPHFERIDWAQVAAVDLRILVGAIELYSGNFEVFDSNKTLEQMGLRPPHKEADQYEVTRWRMRRSFSLEGVAASGTLPDVLPAQRIGDTVFPTCRPGQSIRRDAFYWDGLFSQNPPVRQFLDDESKERKPDEIWVVRINPQEIQPREALTTLEEIRDRENDLAGNLSLNQELEHILTVNNWIAQYGKEDSHLRERKVIEIRTIKMKRDTAWTLRLSSKFDRSHQHLTRLHDEGRAVAADWLEKWRNLGDDFDTYPNDARYTEPRSS